jgi:hypothetical protein
MRNFLKIAEGVDVTPLLAELARQPELWDQNRLRTTHPMTPHKQVSDIWIRFNDLAEYEKSSDPSKVIDEHESIWYPTAAKLPSVRPMVFALMARVQGERLGRVLITRLAPGCRIEPHEDGGSHAAYYERYHITLQSQPGCIFRAGDEAVCMRPGEVWWFDNSQTHEVINESSDDRLTLIVDIKASK